MLTLPSLQPDAALPLCSSPLFNLAVDGPRRLAGNGGRGLGWSALPDVEGLLWVPFAFHFGGYCQGHSTHDAPSELKTCKSSQSNWCLGFQTLLLPVGCPSARKMR